MNELTPKLPRELQRTLEQYYTSPIPRPEFASRLEAQLRQSVQQTRTRRDVPERISFMKLVQARPLAAILIALLALLILSGVAYAIGKVAGYIPGVGIVDQSAPLRVLADPVVVKRDSLTVTISEVVADSEHTFVAYTIDGILVPKMARATCGAMPSLQLPDGSVLDIVNVADGGPQGAQAGSIIKLEQSITYSSILADVNQVTFVLACILPEGTGPENWQMPLALSPAPNDYATPAVEIGATFVASNPAFLTTPTSTFGFVFTPASSDPSFSPSTPDGSGLYLDKVIELPDSYILVGNFTDAGDLPGALEINLDPYEDLPHMEDGSGNPIAFKVRDDIQPEGNDRVWGRSWAYEIAKPVQGPVTITLDQVSIAMSETTQFSFDTGPHPQVGQKWELNIRVRLRNYDYVIDSVEMIEGGYIFKYHSRIDVPPDSLFLNIVGYSPEQDNGRTDHRETVIEYSKGLIYSTPFPAGKLTVELAVSESVPLQGPWTLKWTP